MKKFFFVLVTFFCWGNVFHSVYAMQLPDASREIINNASLPVHAGLVGLRSIYKYPNSFVNRLVIDDHNDQKLFGELCQKMGLDSKKIHLIPGGYASVTGASRVPVDYVKGTGMVYEDCISFSEHDCCYPRNQRAFILVHELAHIKNGDSLKKRTTSEHQQEISVENDSRLREKQADLMAIAVLKDKFGALEFFKSACKENLECRRKISEFLSSKKKNKDYVSISKFLYRGIFSRDTTLANEDLVDEEGLKDAMKAIDEKGNNLFNKKHPLLTDRIAYCNAALQDPTLCTIQSFPFQFASSHRERENLKAVVASATI